MIMTQNQAYYESLGSSTREEQGRIQYEDDLQVPPNRVFRSLALQREDKKKKYVFVGITVLVILNTVMIISFTAGYAYHSYHMNNELVRVSTEMEQLWILVGRNVTLGNTSTEQLQALSDYIRAQVTASYNNLSRTSLETLNRVTDRERGLAEQVEILNSSVSDLRDKVLSPLKLYQGCRIDIETCSIHSRPNDQPQYSRTCNTPSALVNITVRCS